MIRLPAQAALERLERRACSQEADILHACLPARAPPPAADGLQQGGSSVRPCLR